MSSERAREYVSMVVRVPLWGTIIRSGESPDILSDSLKGRRLDAACSSWSLELGGGGAVDVNVSVWCLEVDTTC
jgi:hypothetical protein